MTAPAFPATFPLVPCDQRSCDTYVEPHVGRCDHCRRKHGPLTEWRPGIHPSERDAKVRSDRPRVDRARPRDTARARTEARSPAADGARLTFRRDAVRARPALRQWAPR